LLFIRAVTMLLPTSLPLAVFFSITIMAQVILTGSDDTAAASTAVGDAPPSSARSYQGYESTRTVKNSDTSFYGSMSAPASSMGAINASGSTTSESSTSTSVTLLVGGQRTATSNRTILSNATASQPSSTAEPTNTTPCNGHPKFCSMLYSNITYIAAHNSPFSRPGNAASNQELDVEYQLEDGIRMRKLWVFHTLGSG
jgi:hypothetical protein